MHIYNVTVRTFTQRLTALASILEKADLYIKEGAITEAALLNDSLAPDMYPLKRQVQLATDHAKGLTAKLTGKENPKMPDVEETILQLQERIQKTLAFLATVTEADMAGADDVQVEMKKYPGKYLTGADYALEYALPNFYFHITTAYDLLRKNGVPLGKTDFLNGYYTLKDL